MKPDAMDAVFAALAHEQRRRILDLVKQQPGCKVGDVAAQFETSRIAVMKHLGVLERAGLLHSEKVGRERQLFFNTVPIQMIYDRWTSDYARLWAATLTRVKYQVENKPKGRKK